MSIEQTNLNVSTEDTEINERDYWKEQANIRGVSYANNIPTAKLKELYKHVLQNKKLQIQVVQEVVKV